ncbi:MAG: hypothetical protein J3Q66DRAFT_363865 [Benniella sp.]|nr:MAG: hypothetical protein J3Q66DRAFT_363865 [Benniella sp.]
MDQEIEAQAREFLVFFEECSQLPRAVATSEIVRYLKDLQAFLERVLPIIDPASGSSGNGNNNKSLHSSMGGKDVFRAGEGLIVRASELYPTLGPLLTHLCRNSVILASKPIASLVAQSMFKYANHDLNQHQDQGSKQWTLGPRDGWKGQRPKSSPEQAWTAARLHDLVETSSSREDRRSSTSGRNFTRENSRNHEKGFGALFQISDNDMRQQRIDQTIITLSKSLVSLQEVLQEKLPRAVDLVFLIQWNHQLSGLCGPVVTHPTATSLVQGIIGMACTLKSIVVQNYHRHNHLKDLVPSLLDAAFVRQVMDKMDERNQETLILSDDPQLLRLCSVSRLARQTYVIQLIDGMMTALTKREQEQERGVPVQNRDTIFRLYVEPSRLFAAISSDTSEDSTLLQSSILEDLAELTGQVADWRLVRICTLLVEWMITTRIRRAPSMELDEHDEICQNQELEALISIACSVMRLGQQQPTEENARELIERFMSAQGDYIYSSAGPEQTSLRRRLAFLVATAVSQHEGFLVYRICGELQRLEAAYEVEEEEEIPTASSSCLSRTTSPVVLLMANLVVTHDTDPLFTTVAERMAALLNDLGRLRLDQDVECHKEKDFQSCLADILHAYRPFFEINWTLVAHVLFALGFYMSVDMADSTSWQCMVWTMTTTECSAMSKLQWHYGLSDVNNRP